VSIISIAVTLFLIANPVGTIPVVLSLVRGLPFDRQKKVLFREAMIALLLALFFQFFGKVFLGALNIQQFAVTLGGGVAVFLVSLKMIFPVDHQEGDAAAKTEPLVVPIATPLIAGPGLLAVIMLYSQQESDILKMTGAILIAWIGITAVLTFSPYVQKLLGRRGMIALEQLMGMVLAMMSVDMLVNGTMLFLKQTA
jgi:multiple antibiotic resistance protein